MILKASILISLLLNALLVLRVIYLLDPCSFGF